MKKALCLIAILAMVATAGATVRVFVTSSASPYGLNEPWNAFTPTFSRVTADNDSTNGLDYYNSVGSGAGDNINGFSIAAYPPIDAPSGTIANPVEIANDGSWAYIWIQFQNETKNELINALKIQITKAWTNPLNPNTAFDGVETAYYVMNDQQGDSAGIRWNGQVTEGEPEFRNNPQVLGAISGSLGIKNQSNLEPNLFHTQSGTDPRTGVALLGAVRGIEKGMVTLRIDITEINTSTSYIPVVAGGFFHMIPEPASLVLMALAGLALRRR
jgi:hypothetical protein